MVILQNRDYAGVRGFNYQPSYGSCGLEIWGEAFDGDLIATEIARGKAYFPGINTLRLWFSHDAWMRYGGAAIERFGEAIGAAAAADLRVIATLFNGWHAWPNTPEIFAEGVDAVTAFANDKNKGLVATETGWGALDDAKRCEVLSVELEALSTRGIGFTAHLLNHTFVVDGHRPEHGPISGAGYMAFIEADGSLRPHHECFNDF
ncbi:MAG: hypothetical protein K9N51_11605 [Candidatus Pacebacteria bacterium]|nr:hypothetical protein [Candidatus Paceibacterota bacterium]